MVPQGLTNHLKSDIPAGLVVFLVALPLCLGIALASGAPLFSGIVTGIVGGVVVAMLSRSSLAVSGPAAGLTVIVLDGIETLGSFQGFLVAVILAGFIQLIFGFLKAGIIALFFPSSVIKGMLAAIGIILILKQIPHFFGVDSDFFGDYSFWQVDGRNTFSQIGYALENINFGVVLVGIISLMILIAWEQPYFKQHKILKLIPGALVVVVLGILMNLLFISYFPAVAIQSEHMVSLPLFDNFADVRAMLPSPDFVLLQSIDVYVVGLTIAIIASIETLLSVEATDKLDPYKRVSPTNRELKAQGVGNIISGFLGGLPMTAVIVRSSANINSGGKTRMAAFIHGIFLAVSVFTIPFVLNLIPLSALAAVLLLVGYKLASLKLLREQFRLGGDQAIPFFVTIIAIVFTDLLIGITIGMVVGVYTVLRENYRHSHYQHEVASDISETNKEVNIQLSEHVSFLNKASIQRDLHLIPENSTVKIDGSKSTYIDRDVLEIIEDFHRTAKEKNIKLKLVDMPDFKPQQAAH